MCLVDAKIKEITEDIVCYKVYYISLKGELVSPYIRSLAPNMNEITKTHLGEPYGIENYVEEGFHSFATLEDAINEKEDILKHCHKVIVKCVIPKDSKCYIGTFGRRISYCSESIILKEVVNVIK